MSQLIVVALGGMMLMLFVVYAFNSVIKVLIDQIRDAVNNLPLIRRSDV